VNVNTPLEAGGGSPAGLERVQKGRLALRGLGAERPRTLKGTRRDARIRVVLIDGQTLLRAALRSLISRDRDIEVVGEAAWGPAAAALVGESRPDVVLLDLTTAGADAMTAIEEIRRANPAIRLLVLGRATEGATVRAAVAAGVTGYVVPEAGADEVVAAIRAVRGGRLFVYLGAGPQAAAPLWGAHALPRHRSGLAALSGRERQVLALVAHGCTSVQIGHTLTVSVKTVETYRARITAKLGLQTRFELVRFALDTGLLQAAGGDGAASRGDRPDRTAPSGMLPPEPDTIAR
jgi:DNA-binding NarL/FixJ family response regulator